MKAMGGSVQIWTPKYPEINTLSFQELPKIFKNFNISIGQADLLKDTNKKA